LEKVPVADSSVYSPFIVIGSPARRGRSGDHLPVFEQASAIQLLYPVLTFGQQLGLA
jgi:hypothetical protein